MDIKHFLEACKAASTDGDWQIFFLDMILIIDFAVLAYWFHVDLTRRAFKIISISFLIVILGKIVLLFSDLLLALDYNAEHFWFLDRYYRELIWRYSAAVGFSVIVYQLIYGRFTKDKVDEGIQSNG